MNLDVKMSRLPKRTDVTKSIQVRESDYIVTNVRFCVNALFIQKGFSQL